MLREVKNAGFSRRRTLLGARWSLLRGGTELTRRWSGRRHRALLARQGTEPVPLLREGRRTYWLFADRLWWEEDDLRAHDVQALLRQREQRRARRLASAHAELAREADPRPRRTAIPRALRLATWERDGGACVQCGARFELQFDHVIPVSRGGATSLANLQVLCGDCNRAKSDAIG